MIGQDPGGRRFHIDVKEVLTYAGTSMTPKTAPELVVLGLTQDLF